MPNEVAKPQRKGPPPGAGLLLLLKPYKLLVATLVTLTIVGNGLNLVVPKLISRAIDAYTAGNFVLQTVVLQFLVTGFLVFLQQRVLSGRSYTTVAGKAFRPRNLNLGPWRWFTLGLAVVYLIVVVVLPSLAIIVAAFRKFMFIRDVGSLFDMKQYSMMHFNSIFDNPLTLKSIYNALEVGFITAVVGGALAFAIGYTIHRTNVPGRRSIDLISTIPVAIPGLVEESFPVGKSRSTWTSAVDAFPPTSPVRCSAPA